MKSFNNELIIHHGETFTIDKTVQNKDGSPYIISSELENYIFNNADRIANKCSFDEIKVKEYDSVELVVEKDKYAKFGIHKGAKGVVAYNKATNNNVLVDFGVITEDFDGLLSVSVDDIMKI